MEPFLSDGDLVTVEPLHQRLPKPGSVVLFEEEGQLVLHRIVRLFRKGGKWTAIARGDGASTWSQEVDCDLLLGIATGARRSGGEIRIDSWYSRLRGRAWAYSLAVRRLLRRTKC